MKILTILICAGIIGFALLMTFAFITGFSKDIENSRIDLYNQICKENDWTGNFSSKNKKLRRNIINKVLSNNKTLPFWKIMEDAINKPEVQKELISCLYPSFPYTCFEYDGKSFVEFKDIPSEWIIKRAPEFDTNNSAKIWFRILIGDKTIRTFEIRMKSGYLNKGSFQILVYKGDRPSGGSLKKDVTII